MLHGCLTLDLFFVAFIVHRSGSVILWMKEEAKGQGKVIVTDDVWRRGFVANQDSHG